LKDRVWEENIKAEDEEFKLKMDLLRHQKLNEYTNEQENNDKKELEYKLMVEDFQRDLKLKDVERERRLRRLAEEEVLKNEEFMRTYKEHENVLKEEEEIQLKRFLDEERENAIRRAEERLGQLEQEKRTQALELEMYREKLKTISSEQKKREFEDKILEIRKRNEIKVLEEERNLQKMLLEIEEERKVQKEMQQELISKEKDFVEKKSYHQTLKRSEERLLEDERRKFEEFRYALRSEIDKVEEVKRKMEEAKNLENYPHSKDYALYNSSGMKRRSQNNSRIDYKGTVEDGLESEKDDVLSPSQNYEGKEEEKIFIH
jgi:hypothetical protein